MTLLITGLTVFFLVHLVPSITRLREHLTKKLGLKSYKLYFSLTAFAGLIMIVLGMVYAPFEPLWEPAFPYRRFIYYLNLIAFILLVSAQMPSNIKRFVRHPMLSGVIIWSVAHLLVNGDKASMILFGSFLTYGIYANISANLREEHRVNQKYTINHDIAVITAALIVYGIVLFSHEYLFGVAVLS